MFTITGSRRESALKSLRLTTSAHRSNPAARAISTLCSTTFVDPPIAIATVSALRSEAGVTMSRGRIPASVIATRQSISWPGNSFRRRGSSDGGATICNGSMPSTAMNVCIVL